MLSSQYFDGVPDYAVSYLSLVNSDDLEQELESNKLEILNFFESLNPEKWTYAYAPNKWTISQVLQHLIDVERIFSYRALRFSRKDESPLSGFNENEFIENANAAKLNPELLINEFNFLRSANLIMFKKMDEEMLSFKGNVMGYSINAKQLGFMLVGHAQHHLNVLNERYF